ncbi:MAG: phenylalanyl-tRNA synthetase beta subunit [Verrucomicrobiales bacterium]|nr:phenylalanyl-tRNA synthetase beta subunit [Verrucomicrobiales bacterium]
MKVTLNWLKQYVDFNWTPEELTERLTMLGLEVEGVQKVSGEFEGIVVGQILTKDKVAGSDKLSVCKVNDGQMERTIICGAQNHNPGDKIPVILPNFALPLKAGEKEPFVIKERKVFGITSQGMMCSPQELGLPDNVDGLLLLPQDAPVGKPFAEYLGRTGGDVVYDLEITPNRPDWNSVIGIAREISALTGNPLKIPDTGTLKAAGNDSIEKFVSVRIEDAELCPRYTARLVRGVKIGPSPEWLKSALEKVGLRSINNVVDVTNYVMLEVGQPLHAFDYHLLQSAAGKTPTIVVRRASEGEKFKTLDGKEYTLTNGMLLIADETKGVALAGIMGGQNSEINEKTVDVLIESAYFKPQNIRATSKKLEIRTDSSYRFERGGDVGICDWASRRCAHLILETAGGELLQSSIDAYPAPLKPKEISLRHQKADELLGIRIPGKQQVEFLSRLGLETIVANGEEFCTVRIPTFRVDMKREVDLIEEIVRLHGIDKIPSSAPRGAIGSNAFDKVFDELSEARRLLLSLGLNEAQGQTLISDAAAKLVTPETSIQALANPLSSDMNVLRPSLLPGLLDSLRHNVSRKNYDLALFEIGRVFTNDNGVPKEERRVAIAITGQRNPLFWSGSERDAKLDAYDLKGLLEEFIENFGLRGIAYVRREEKSGLFLESASLNLGKMSLGELGQLLPPLAKRYDLRDAVFLAELNLDLLLARRNTSKSLKALPAFPSSRRDVAMLVPETVNHDSVLNLVKQTKTATLESVELFDVFRGKNIPEGQKSMAYAFTYRSGEKTLTDVEVNGAHEKIVEQLKTKLQAVVRDS